MNIKEYIEEVTEDTPYGKLRYIGQYLVTATKERCKICGVELSGKSCIRLDFEEAYPKRAFADKTRKYVCIDHNKEE